MKAIVESEKDKEGLTTCAFVFGLIAVIMTVAPHVIARLLNAQYEREGCNAKFGVITFYMFYGFAMMALGFISWVASMMLLIVSLVKRDGIHTSLRHAVMILNALCLLFYVFVIHMIVRSR